MGTRARRILGWVTSHHLGHGLPLEGLRPDRDARDAYHPHAWPDDLRLQGHHLLALSLREV